MMVYVPVELPLLLLGFGDASPTGGGGVAVAAYARLATASLGRAGRTEEVIRLENMV